MYFGHIAGIDKPVSRLVTGTMILSESERQRSLDLLDRVFELGGNAFDTAHGYGGGESERVLGSWMRTRGVRDRVVVLSKGCHHSRDRRRVTPFDLASDLYDSLARLQTDYVDGYLLHRDDPETEVGPMVEALNQHLVEGRIRAYGVSNWTHERIAEANAYAESHGLRPVAMSSPNFGLAEQIQDPWGGGCVSISGPSNCDARRWYEVAQTPVLAYSSLARGLFSGRVRADTGDCLDATLDRACLTAYCHEPNFRRLERAELLARERHATVPQVALAYILTSPLMVFPIVGVTSGEEFKENLRAFEVRLTAGERSWLDLETDQR